MFEALPEHQLNDLTKVWQATKAMHWRERASTKWGGAFVGGCTPEHLAVVIGFDVQVVKRLLRRPRREFHGRHLALPARARPRPVLPMIAAPSGRYGAVVS